MNRFEQIKKDWGGPALAAALAVSLGLALEEFSFGRWLKELSYDLPFVARAHIQPTEALVIYMDEQSHQELNQPLNAPWDRAVHGKLLHRLIAGGARAVAFDIVFSDAGPNPESDAALAEGIRAHGHVVLAADVVPTFQGNGLAASKMVLPPFEGFLTNAASIGSAEVDPGRDLIIRKHLRLTPDDQIATLSWAAAELIGAPITSVPKAQFQERWLNYYGPPDTVPSMSYVTALSDATPVDAFSNKVVFVGARLKTRFSGDRKDEYRTPYSFWSTENTYIAGAEVQATAFLNLARGDWLVEAPRALRRSLLVITGLILGLVLVRLRLGAALLVAVLCIGLAAVAGYLVFVHRMTCFPWLFVVTQVIAALMVAVIYNSLQLYVQKRLAEQSLRLYLSPKLVKKFAQEPKLLQPGAEKQMLTVLFSDIADFTTLSEGLDSDELARLMNSYFESAVSECIHHTDGTVVKYIGDAIFAFWNAPELQTDHQVRACEAALLFGEQRMHYIRDQPLRTRIGLHTGVANVGNFGSVSRIDYTAIGESINLASRMEGLNKYLGTNILISGDTWEGVRHKMEGRAMGNFRLKGFERTVPVYELLGQRNGHSLLLPEHELFNRGLNAFMSRDLPGAETAFAEALALKPHDGASTFYLRRIKKFQTTGIPENWQGEVELTDK